VGIGATSRCETITDTVAMHIKNKDMQEEEKDPKTKET